MTEPTTQPTTNQEVNAKSYPGITKIREKRAFTATVVTFALTALLCFMVIFILVTGKEDNGGVIASAVAITISAIQFYFGTKQGGYNG